MKSINFPYSLTVFGETESTSNQAKIWVDRVLTLLSTQLGQRPMAPDYGADVARALFENEDDFRVAFRVAIAKAMSVWLPELNIESITIGDPNQDGFVNIEIMVELPNSRVAAVTISSAAFGANGAITRTGA
jgi:phage baseplate assembly protein W